MFIKFAVNCQYFVNNSIIEFIFISERILKSLHITLLELCKIYLIYYFLQNRNTPHPHRRSRSHVLIYLFSSPRHQTSLKLFYNPSELGISYVDDILNLDLVFPLLSSDWTKKFDGMYTFFPHFLRYSPQRLCLNRKKVVHHIIDFNRLARNFVLLKKFHYIKNSMGSCPPNLTNFYRSFDMLDYTFRRSSELQKQFVQSTEYIGKCHYKFLSIFKFVNNRILC